jgi:glycosyltransferase involved in cell wall biosynthesis
VFEECIFICAFAAQGNFESRSAAYSLSHFSLSHLTSQIMRIGIVPALNPSSGGVYQYSQTLLSALAELSARESGDDFVVFSERFPPPALGAIDGWNCTLQPLHPEQPRAWKTRMDSAVDLMRKVVGEGPHREMWRWLRRRRLRRPPCSNPDAVRFRPDARRWFEECRVELMCYCWPNSLSFETRIPYVMAIHDLQHRLQPEFPEVSANGEWDFREYLFRNGARNATLLVADSEVGKEDILSCYGSYGVTSDRVKVLPFLPAPYLATSIFPAERLRIRTIYNLPDRYLFYPAQFWAHKNHARIVQALALLRDEHRLKIPVVFCGSHAGETRQVVFSELHGLSSRLKLDSQIHYLGYVPEEDMSALYGEALALVMPTFFGPTNIPVLEAWACGCPVLTSGIRGIREQVGDAAVLADPNSAESIAEGIYRLWTDESLRSALIEAGRRRLGSYGPAHFRDRLYGILQEAKDRVRSEVRHA